jgi:hypothetical protein
MDSIDHERAALRLAELVVSVEDSELTLPTPCPAYTLGDVIDHVGGLALAFAAPELLEGAAPAARLVIDNAL